MKKKKLKKIEKKLKGYRADIEAAKASAHFMLLNKRASVVPDRKKFNKKAERRKNKIKGF